MDDLAFRRGGYKKNFNRQRQPTNKSNNQQKFSTVAQEHQKNTEVPILKVDLATAPKTIYPVSLPLDSLSCLPSMTDLTQQKCESLEKPENERQPVKITPTIYGERLRKRILSEMEADRINKEKKISAVEDNIPKLVKTKEESNKIPMSVTNPVRTEDMPQKELVPLTVPNSQKLSKEDEKNPTQSRLSLQIREMKLEGKFEDRKSRWQRQVQEPDDKIRKISEPLSVSQETTTKKDEQNARNNHVNYRLRELSLGNQGRSNDEKIRKEDSRYQDNRHSSEPSDPRFYPAKKQTEHRRRSNDRRGDREDSEKNRNYRRDRSTSGYRSREKTPDRRYNGRRDDRQCVDKRRGEGITKENDIRERCLSRRAERNGYKSDKSDKEVRGEFRESSSCETYKSSSSDGRNRGSDTDKRRTERSRSDEHTTNEREFRKSSPCERYRRSNSNGKNRSGETDKRKMRQSKSVERTVKKPRLEPVEEHESISKRNEESPRSSTVTAKKKETVVESVPSVIEKMEKKLVEDMPANAMVKVEISPVKDDAQEKVISVLEDDTEEYLAIILHSPNPSGSRSFREEKIENIEMFIQNYQEDENLLYKDHKEPGNREEPNSATISVLEALTMDVEDDAFHVVDVLNATMSSLEHRVSEGTVMKEEQRLPLEIQEQPPLPPEFEERPPPPPPEIPEDEKRPLYSPSGIQEVEEQPVPTPSKTSPIKEQMPKTLNVEDSSGLFEPPVIAELSPSSQIQQTDNIETSSNQHIPKSNISVDTETVITEKIDKSLQGSIVLSDLESKKKTPEKTNVENKEKTPDSSTSISDQSKVTDEPINLSKIDTIQSENITDGFEKLTEQENSLCVVKSVLSSKKENIIEKPEELKVEVPEFQQPLVEENSPKLLNPREKSTPVELESDFARTADVHEEPQKPSPDAVPEAEIENPERKTSSEEKRTAKLLDPQEKPSVSSSKKENIIEKPEELKVKGPEFQQPPVEEKSTPVELESDFARIADVHEELQKPSPDAVPEAKIQKLERKISSEKKPTAKLLDPLGKPSVSSSKKGTIIEKSKELKVEIPQLQQPPAEENSPKLLNPREKSTPVELEPDFARTADVREEPQKPSPNAVPEAEIENPERKTSSEEKPTAKLLDPQEKPSVSSSKKKTIIEKFKELKVEIPELQQPPVEENSSKLLNPREKSTPLELELDFARTADVREEPQKPSPDAVPEAKIQKPERKISSEKKPTAKLLDPLEKPSVSSSKKKTIIEKSKELKVEIPELQQPPAEENSPKLLNPREKSTPVELESTFATIADVREEPQKSSPDAVPEAKIEKPERKISSEEKPTAKLLDPLEKPSVSSSRKETIIEKSKKLQVEIPELQQRPVEENSSKLLNPREKSTPVELESAFARIAEVREEPQRPSPGAVPEAKIEKPGRKISSEEKPSAKSLDSLEKPVAVTKPDILISAENCNKSDRFLLVSIPKVKLEKLEPKLPPKKRLVLKLPTPSEKLTSVAETKLRRSTEVRERRSVKAPARFSPSTSSSAVSSRKKTVNQEKVTPVVSKPPIKPMIIIARRRNVQLQDSYTLCSTMVQSTTPKTPKPQQKQKVGEIPAQDSHSDLSTRKKRVLKESESKTKEIEKIQESILSIVPETQCVEKSKNCKESTISRAVLKPNLISSTSRDIDLVNKKQSLKENTTESNLVEKPKVILAARRRRMAVFQDTCFVSTNIRSCTVENPTLNSNKISNSEKPLVDPSPLKKVMKLQENCS